MIRPSNRDININTIRVLLSPSGDNDREVDVMQEVIGSQSGPGPTTRITKLDHVNLGTEIAREDLDWTKTGNRSPMTKGTWS